MGDAKITQGMTPLSPRLRRFYFFGFLMVGLLLLPLVIYYADGWRFKSGYGFVKTGGIFVSLPYSDAEVMIDGKRVGSSSFLSRGLYVDNLAPSAYEVQVAKNGYRPWKRLIIVEPQVVTDMSARLIPETINIDQLLITDVATSTPHIIKETFIAYQAIFSAKKIASSTIPVATFNSVGLFIDHGALYARWLEKNAPPSEFCGRPSYCVKQITVENGETVTRAMFYKGDVIYRTQNGNIYLSEFDARKEPMKIVIFSASGADISIIDGDLIIKSGTKLYQVGSL